MSTGPLLESKLHAPRPRRGLVARPRLGERLRRGVEARLTLVSAPAGFGKTTLLAEWLSTEGVSAAWLSLDQRDDDPAVFWSSVVAALNAARSPGDHVLSPGEAPQGGEVDLSALLNDLGGRADEVVLVLDDYHVIESRDVHDGMAFVLDHLPPQVHVVIATRADPPLPLARMRARGELVEIRVADLRFTADEAATYLTEAMGLALTAQDIAALEERTEGWIAALQLAALSLQDRADAAGFISGFAGDDRYVVDYLVEEVLQRQPDDVRAFLLTTSVLHRLHGPLCDAVTGQRDGRATLEALDRANLFVVPLDDRRRWYRYHHLFADMLRARLLDEHPEQVAALHRRASDWYEQHGERSEAIHHALAGGDVERAADLVELALPELRRSRQDATLRGWFEALPDEVLAVRPVLSVGYASALMVRGEVEGVEARLRDAERWLDPTSADPRDPRAPSKEMVVVDHEQLRGLPSAIALYRAGQARILGDVAGTMRHARRALDLAADDDHVGRGAPAALIGLAHWTNGDLDAAHRAYAEAQASLERAGHLPDVLGCALVLADLRMAQGRLGEALRTYERGLRLATDHGAPAVRGVADMHVGMSELRFERGDLEAAHEHLRASRALGEGAGLPQHPYRWRVVLARIRAAEGDPEAALALLDEAELRFTSDFSPDVRPVPALRARVLAASGRVAEAFGWVRERGLSADDDLSYLREFEHLTLARVLLAQHAVSGAPGQLDDATRLLERLLAAAEAGERTGRVVEVLVLQALSLGKDRAAARARLHRALSLAEPEGFVRTFLDEGPPVVALLRGLAKEPTVGGHARRLIAAATTTPRDAPSGPGLVDPLSDRELHVLRLLATDLSGPEIARELVVSLNTVRTHTKHIYAKLGVSDRRAAIRTAAGLDLLPRSHER